MPFRSLVPRTALSIRRPPARRNLFLRNISGRDRRFYARAGVGRGSKDVSEHEVMPLHWISLHCLKVSTLEKVVR